MGEVERKKVNVCGGFIEQRAMDFNGVFATVGDPRR